MPAMISTEVGRGAAGEAGEVTVTDRVTEWDREGVPVPIMVTV